MHLVFLKHIFAEKIITSTCCFRRSGMNMGYYYGRGSGPIWPNNFRCLGNESSFEECRHDGGGYRSCNHQQDVSIVCGNSTCKSRNCFVIAALYCRHVILSQRNYIFRCYLFLLFRDTISELEAQICAGVYQSLGLLLYFIFHPAANRIYF